MAISIDVVRETYPKYQLDTKTSTKPTENIALVSNDIQTVGDSLHLSTAKVKQEKTQEQSGTEKQSNTKKWLKIAGVTAGVVLSGVALAYLFKRGSSKIAGDSLEKLKQIDDFNVLKDLKMCQNLSPSEKKSFWNMLVTDDKQIFLGTLSDNKPMSLFLLETHNTHDELLVHFIKKLKLG